MKKAPKVRLFINQNLAAGATVVPETAQVHYLTNVLRLTNGDEICVFDGKSGEYVCRPEFIGKKNCVLNVGEKIRDFYACPDIWLLFAPVKKDKTDFIIEKATELGAAGIIPVLTERTISERIKKERYLAQSIEASEQCRRLDIPCTSDMVPLEKVLKNWDKERILYFMDESGQGDNICEVLQKEGGKKAAFLVGPEGGFSPKETDLIRSFAFTRPISLGKRILRAETAVAAALSCWQALCGDWNLK